MNEVIEKAYELNELQYQGGTLIRINCEEPFPDLDVGDICTVSDVCNGDIDCSDGNTSYSYLVTERGTDGKSHKNIYIKYSWEILEEDEDDFLDSEIEITGIELI